MHSSKKTFLFLALIIMLAAFFRLQDLKTIPPGLYPDEAMNGNNALYALKSGDFGSFYPQNNGREGLFINIQALSVSAFGNEAWALRLVSSLFGILTVLGIFFLARELFRGFIDEGLKISGFKASEIIALSASFFMAASFWHINFSRIGFRAIMAPFFMVWALYFFLVSFRREISLKLRSFASVAGGFFLGLGAHSYIAYRLAPFLLLPVLFRFFRTKKDAFVFVLFILAGLAAFLPLGIYFWDNPQDFLGRTSQISVFSSESPLKDFGLNLAKTLGSFWFAGDYNPRHNFPGAPQLWAPVGILFALGLAFSLFKRGFPVYVLWTWLILFSLPVAFSAEGLPHALRAILMLPPAVLLASFGFWQVLDWLRKKFESSRARAPFFVFLVAAFFAAHAVMTYSDYFIRWANTPDVYYAFNANYAEMAGWLNRQDPAVPKYVVVNASGVLAETPDAPSRRGIPMPSQTIMFLTDTWTAENQKSKNISYLLPEELAEADCRGSCLIFALESDPALNSRIKDTFQGLGFSVAPGFGVFYKNTALR